MDDSFYKSKPPPFTSSPSSRDKNNMDDKISQRIRENFAYFKNDFDKKDIKRGIGSKASVMPGKMLNSKSSVEAAKSTIQKQTAPIKDKAANGNIVAKSSISQTNR